MLLLPATVPGVCEIDVQIVDSKTGGFVPNYLFPSLCSVFLAFVCFLTRFVAFEKKVTLSSKQDGVIFFVILAVKNHHSKHGPRVLDDPKPIQKKHRAFVKPQKKWKKHPW